MREQGKERMKTEMNGQRDGEVSDWWGSRAPPSKDVPKKIDFFFFKDPLRTFLD